ncbi:KEOPS complex subunit Cgi121 [Methanosphaera cuniculi]|nr:KEOPS complex subunit Cgi121 [Methanosphaera cuniculi]
MGNIMEDLQKQILDEKQITIHTYQDNIVDNIPELLGKINEITQQNPDSTIQLLDTQYICGKKHLKQAIAEAIVAFKNNTNFAKDLGLEICVRTSAQKQIKDAIKLLGIKTSGNITVIYINTRDDQIKQVEEILNTKNDTLIDEYDTNTIKKAYKIDCEDDTDILDMLNEKIAMLVIKN